MLQIRLGLGPSIKYVTIEGDEKVWHFVTGGLKACDVTLYKFFSYIWNLKLKVMFSFLL